MAHAYHVSQDTSTWRRFLQHVHEQHPDATWPQFQSLVDQTLAAYNATHNPLEKAYVIRFTDAESLTQFLLAYS